MVEDDGHLEIPMKRPSILAGLAFLVAVAPLPALATTSLTVLPTPFSCNGSCSLAPTLLSPDGTLVVGGTRSGSAGFASGHGVRWTESSGWAQSPSGGTSSSDSGFRYEQIGIAATNVLAFNYDEGGGWSPYIQNEATSPNVFIDPPSALCGSFGSRRTIGISADGTTVAGLDSTCGSYVTTLATLDTVLITPLTSKATSISDDGDVVAGEATVPALAPFVWSSASGYQELSIPLRSGRHPRISGDGSTLVGDAVTVDGTEVFAWNAADGVTYLGDLPGLAVSSAVADVSHDGTLVAGTGSSATGSEAFAWTRAGGLIGSGIPSTSIAMTPGGIVVGRLIASPSEDDVFVWNPRTGWLRSVESLLRDAGVTVPSDGLGSVVGISNDGRTITGWRAVAGTSGEPWLAEIDEPGLACDVEMSQAAYVDGDSVEIASLRFTNHNQTLSAARLRLQLTLPFGITADVLDLGAGGGFFVPASFDHQLGPVTMFTLQPGQPRGGFTWRCALEDPVSGAILAEDTAPFAFE